jgi:hypothetical protein
MNRRDDAGNRVRKAVPGRDSHPDQPLRVPAIRSSLLLLRSMLAVLVLLAGNGLGPSWSEAAPIVSVDLDSATPGIQPNLEVDAGALIDAAVVIGGVDAIAPLNAFQIALSFDDAVLRAQAVDNGGFLLEPTIVVSDLTAPGVNIAVSSLLPTGAVGEGLLAQVTFQALSAGTALLALTQVDLSAPFGIPIAVGAIAGAQLTVREVPAPGALVLTALGLGVLASMRRRREESPPDVRPRGSDLGDESERT